MQVCAVTRRPLRRPGGDGRRQGIVAARGVEDARHPRQPVNSSLQPFKFSA
jgi:hypothetical protein